MNKFNPKTEETERKENRAGENDAAIVKNLFRLSKRIQALHT